MKMQMTYDETTPCIVMEGCELPDAFQLRYFDDDTGGPQLTMRFRARADRVECVSLLLEATDDGREVTNADLRAINVLDNMEIAVQLAALPIELMTDSKGKFIGVVRRTWPPTWDQGRQAVKAVNQRRLRVAPARLRQVAELVRTSDDPVTAVEDALDVQRRAAQLWIKRARDMTDPVTGQPYLESRSST